MKLYLRNNGTKENWIDIDLGDGEPFKLLLDYPTPEQEQKLQSILFGVDYLGNDKIIKYAQLIIKYSVKGWKGITDKDGKEVELKLDKNEMDTEQWWAFVRDPDFALQVFQKINEKIKFTDIDKKKLSTAPFSKMEEILKDKEGTTQ